MRFISGVPRLSRTAAVCALVICLEGGRLAAQAPVAAPASTPQSTTPPASAEPQESKGTSTSPRVGQGPEKNAPPEFRRWGVGGLFTYVPPPFRLMRNGTVTGTTATLTSTNNARPFGGGVAGYYYLTKTLSLNLDFIYRRTGYSTTDVLDDATTTSYFSRTRANYFDFPLLARYHSGRYHLLHSPVFIEGGPTLRYVEQITTSTTVDTTVNSAVTSVCCTEIPDRPDHRAAIGITAGVGLRLPPDQLGVRIVPEIRYTRWMQSTFSAAPTMSNRDQAEVLLTISF